VEPALLERLNELLRKYRPASSWLLVLVAIVAYRGVLACGFVYDDVQLILQNPLIKNPHLWKRIFLGSLFSFEGVSAQGGFYRPLTIFSYWLVCRVDGFNPFAFHLFSLALYALSVWVVYRIGGRILQNDLAAFAGAALWALNPLHVEAVAWLSALSDVGCTLFCLLSFWIFLRAEEHAPKNFWWHIAAAAVYFPALFFKEMAFSFPLILLAYWFCFTSQETWARRMLNWSPYWLAVAGCAAIRVAAMGSFSQHALLRGSGPKAVWAGLAILGQHASIFLWPVNLSEFRDFNLSSSLHSPWPYLVLSVVVLLCLVRRRTPRLTFLVLWWLISLLPVLNYRQLSIPVVADRFSLTATVGLCLALGYMALVWAPRRFPKPGVVWLAVGFLAAVAMFWTLQTVKAIPHWRDNDSLFGYGLQISPNAAVVHQVHGVVMQFREHDLEGAAREFRTALRLDAESLHRAPGVTYNSYIGLGQVALLQGRENEALDYFEKAVQISPGSFFAYDVLGSYYFPRRDYAQAAKYFQRSVQVDPQDVHARYTLGLCWMKMAMPAQAAEQFHAARVVDPTFFQAYTAEAKALDAMGDHAHAAQVRALTPK
jgi:tetratricopeptide (TPR) repeat protein